MDRQLPASYLVNLYRQTRSLRTLPWLCVLVCVITPRPAASQAPSAGDDRPLFVSSDPYVLAAFAVATVAMFPLDRRLASSVRDSALITNRKLHETSKVFRFFGGAGPYLIGGTMYVAGRALRSPRLTQLAIHGTESVAVGWGVSGVLKLLLGRARPYTSADTNPRSFAVGRGIRGTDYQSFPSGHSTSAFAAAAAVSAEMSTWWPQQRWIFNPVLYGGAALVGVSRMYEDKHWASDVVMGAAIGSFAGLKVVRFNHTRDGNRLDRFLMGSAGPSGVRMYSDGAGSLGVHVRLQF